MAICRARKAHDDDCHHADEERAARIEAVFHFLLLKKWGFAPRCVLSFVRIVTIDSTSA